jgi:hypothetical protein
VRYQAGQSGAIPFGSLLVALALSTDFGVDTTPLDEVFSSALMRVFPSAQILPCVAFAATLFG